MRTSFVSFFAKYLNCRIRLNDNDFNLVYTYTDTCAIHEQHILEELHIHTESNMIYHSLLNHSFMYNEIRIITVPLFDSKINVIYDI